VFQGYSNETFEFFMAIRFNNNRPFFQDNRDWYLRAVREPSIALAQDLADLMEDIDPNLERRPHRVVSRINRDIRFARDKSPYRDCCWISFHHIDEEKGRLPGFYFEVRDSGGFCGMGFYKGNKALMDLIRKLILEKPQMMLDLVLPVMEEYHFFPELSSRIAIPEEVPVQLRALYAAKSFYFEKVMDDFDLIRSPALAQELRRSFERLRPLYRTIIDLYMQQA